MSYSNNGYVVAFVRVYSFELEQMMRLYYN